MKRRKAFTLVELLMTVTMGSSLMLLAIGLVHQSLSLSKLATKRSDYDRSLARLVQQFRSDVHEADEAVSAALDLPAALHLKMSDERKVTYLWDAGSVLRERIGPGTEVGRESFHLAEDCSVIFQIDGKPSRALVRVERRSKNSDVPSRVDLRVVAVVGRWRSLEQWPEDASQPLPLQSSERATGARP